MLASRAKNSSIDRDGIDTDVWRKNECRNSTDVLGHSDVAQLIGAYLDRDPEVFEANAATMLIRRAIGEGWDGKNIQ